MARHGLWALSMETPFLEGLLQFQGVSIIYSCLRFGEKVHVLFSCPLYAFVSLDEIFPQL